MRRVARAIGVFLDSRSVLGESKSVLRRFAGEKPPPRLLATPAQRVASVQTTLPALGVPRWACSRIWERTRYDAGQRRSVVLGVPTSTPGKYYVFYALP